VGHRLPRVNETLREVLSAEIAALKDPRIGFVTVTGVEVSPDLRHAKVYVSVMGPAKERERTLAGLRAAHGHLQDRIAADVRIKHTPQLTFHYDESIDRGLRIESLLKRYEAEVRGPDEVGSGAADEKAAGDPADTTGEPSPDERDEADAASGGAG